MQNTPDVTKLLIDVRRTIAIAKIAEFENQAYRLGDYVSTDLLPRPVAADVLLDAATSNGLVREHGDDFIQQIIAEGLNSGVRV
jgi:hypothetical protein